MFDWIEKVVPQPPVKIHVSVVGEKDAPMEQSAAVDGPGLAKLVSGCLKVAVSSLTSTECQPVPNERVQNPISSQTFHKEKWIFQGHSGGIILVSFCVMV